MLFCYYVFKRYYVFDRYYVSCTSVLLSKKVLLYALNNLNNFNENLSPHICTQTSTI